MFTDWMLVRRLAAELHLSTQGDRIVDAGRLSDGRFGLRLTRHVVALDPFAPTPLITLEGEMALTRQPGWTRTMAAALAGLRIDAVRAWPADRLILFDCAARSRFGVESGYRLVVELVPRFGNVILLRDDTVVAAAKEFAPGVARRTTLAGHKYEPPPLQGPGDGGDTLAGIFEDLGSMKSPKARADAAQALRRALPQVPQLVALSIVTEIGDDARACLERAQATVQAAARGAYDRSEIFVYRDGSSIVQCHVTRLSQHASLVERRAPQLLPLLAQASCEAGGRRAQEVFDARRATLRARLERRRLALRAERMQLERERDDVAGRERLREAGELLYAHLADVPAGVSSFVPPSAPDLTIALDPALDAKSNAAAIFKRYKKAAAKLTHVEARLGDVGARERWIDELAWELERANSQTISEIEEIFDSRPRRPGALPRSKRGGGPMEIRLAHDARVYVGRSPRGNVELTFRIARPADLWFHARGTPGAHVVLRIDSPRAATDAEIERAAALAAYHSKGREASKISVDYTTRRYVRRRKDAPPGLVWYTGARTIVVHPRDETGGAAQREEGVADERSA